MIKNPPANAGDAGDVGPFAGLARSPGVEDGYPLQYTCRENPMDRGAWPARVPKVSNMTEPHSTQPTAEAYHLL